MTWRRFPTISAFVGALLLTAGAWREVMFYKNPPPANLALWLPFIVLLRAHDIAAILVWLVQFPVLAGIFLAASRRWPPQGALAALLAVYALCSGAAFLMLRTYS